jgi:hypothetical protein
MTAFKTELQRAQPRARPLTLTAARLQSEAASMRSAIDRVETDRIRDEVRPLGAAFASVAAAIGRVADAIDKRDRAALQRALLDLQAREAQRIALARRILGDTRSANASGPSGAASTSMHSSLPQSPHLNARVARQVSLRIAKVDDATFKAVKCVRMTVGNWRCRGNWAKSGSEHVYTYGVSASKTGRVFSYAALD